MSTVLVYEAPIRAMEKMAAGAEFWDAEVGMVRMVERFAFDCMTRAMTVWVVDETEPIVFAPSVYVPFVKHL